MIEFFKQSAVEFFVDIRSDDLEISREIEQLIEAHADATDCSFLRGDFLGVITCFED